jgi:hypothetical protein
MTTKLEAPGEIHVEYKEPLLYWQTLAPTWFVTWCYDCPTCGVRYEQSRVVYDDLEIPRAKAHLIDSLNEAHENNRIFCCGC